MSSLLDAYTVLWLGEEPEGDGELTGVVEGDCIERMGELPDGSVDAVVTDPPYGLEFMGKEWDRLGATNEAATDSPGWRAGHGGLGAASKVGGVPFGGGGQRVRYGASAASAQVWHEEWAREALRVLRPGGHLLAFGGTRTYHRLTCAIEDAGFEIRDCLVWLYGSGFPKSKNLHGDHEGWGTALKPAHEPIVLARKPFRGSVAANVLVHGTGALHVDACRIDYQGEADIWKPEHHRQSSRGDGYHGINQGIEAVPGAGRWPANVALDGEAAAMLDGASRFFFVSRSAADDARSDPGSPSNPPTRDQPAPGPDRRTSDDRSRALAARTDQGPLADSSCGRMLYAAKASSAERNAGLGAFEAKPAGVKNASGRGYSERDPYAEVRMRNVHPTVKPIDLMRWLVRLVCPPGGLVLDPFAGSGTTGIACALEGMRFVGFEREPEYAAIARARLEWWSRRDAGDTAAVLASISAQDVRGEQMELVP